MTMVISAGLEQQVSPSWVQTGLTCPSLRLSVLDWSCLVLLVRSKNSEM